jgi:c-di-GMP-binding flagellar brake protein YcgR
MIERRQSIRVECELSSKFRTLDKEHGQKLSEAVVRNISRGGVRILLDRFIPLQANIFFYLALPHQEVIEVRILPAWVVELPNLGKYEMGARFVEMTPQQEDVIQNYQYRSLLDRMPSHKNVIKDLQRPSRDPGLVA